MKKFKCKSCGNCCIKFGIKNNLSYLPIYEWELNDLLNLSKKNNLELDIKPITVLYDRNSKQAFSVIYGLFNSPCVFLDKNKKCIIYKNRPLVCRAYPIFWTSYYKYPLTPGCFGECPNFNHDEFIEKSKNLNKKELSKKMKDIYNKTYENCKKTNFINIELTNLLKKLESDKKVFLEEISNNDYNKHNIISLKEFLINNNLLLKKEYNNLIKRFKRLKK